MKQTITIMMLLVANALSTFAQETYENARLASHDLNGTARYVGMGGAMDALGADLSTISSNPAGIGLFRSSAISGTLGFISKQGSRNFADSKKNITSFDQAGFVYAMRTSNDCFLNFAFNYHKSKNFGQILTAAGRLADGASQGRLTYNKGAIGGIWGIEDMKKHEISSNDLGFNQMDYLYCNTILYNPLLDPVNPFVYYGAEQYDFGRSNKGYIANYDFNISGNIHDRVYIGLTFGFKDVHYKSYCEYAELYGENEAKLGGVLVEDHRKISGTGVDVTAGIIVRPFDASPFRIGFSIATPTFYDLKTKNTTALLVDVSQVSHVMGYETYNGPSALDIDYRYDFKMNTPWRFALSAGHTIGQKLALGTTVEYADYSSIDTRLKDEWVDEWGYTYDNSESDNEMNHHTKKTLKGVATVKLGAEYKPIPQLALRAGYNYVSPMYKSSGVKDGMLYSWGNRVQSSTDYTNWKATNRLTAGVGTNLGKWNLDLAYQYSRTDGDFYPYFDTLDKENIVENKKVSEKRHQLLFTVGYRF
ncbi:MAG: outer membrane protein transport protein [Prevotella sp.]|nr:outer membrane protein transport protein [Prevotella sp.]